jgi:hypothetical protein
VLDDLEAAPRRVQIARLPRGPESSASSTSGSHAESGEAAAQAPAAPTGPPPTMATPMSSRIHAGSERRQHGRVTLVDEGADAIHRDDSGVGVCKLAIVPLTAAGDAEYCRTPRPSSCIAS